MTAAYFRPTVFLLGLFTVISGFSLWEGQQVTRRHEDPATVTETVRNFLQCKNLCDRRSSCKSVYYDTSTRECTSNFREFVIPEEDLASHVAGVVFSEKSVVTQSTDVCSDVPCKDTQLCLPLGSDAVCLTEEIDCGPPPEVANANGITNSTTTNSVATYTCNAGYVITTGNTTSMCDVTRSWTPTYLSCVVDCGKPVIANGNFSYESTTQNSSATVVCEEHFRFFGTSQSARCDSAGHWSELDGGCFQVKWTNKTRVDASVPGTITEGWSLFLRGIPAPPIKHFSINLIHQFDIDFHMDVKFHYKGSVKTVLFNSEVDSNWGTAHEITDPFPFNESDPFNVQILLQMPSFKVSVNNVHFYDFQIESSPADIDRIEVIFDVQCSTTGVTTAVVCVILSVGWCI